LSKSLILLGNKYFLETFLSSVLIYILCITTTERCGYKLLNYNIK